MAKKDTTKSKSTSSKHLFGEAIKEESPEKTIKTSASAPGLFDYMNMMFSKPQEFSKLRSYEKAKHFFMFQRFFAIKHPIQASMLNHININTGEAVQYWCDSLTKIYTSTPSWIFKALKEVKKNKTIEKKKFDIKDSTIQFYCDKNQCSRRDIYDALAIYEQDFIEELKEIEKLIS